MRQFWRLLALPGASLGARGLRSEKARHPVRSLGGAPSRTALIAIGHQP
jgi:hypothetical protein